MNQLPSERIKEIFDKQYTGIDNCLARAVIDYLDEEHEQNKPCEHQWDTAGECNLCGKFYK